MVEIEPITTSYSECLDMMPIMRVGLKMRRNQFYYEGLVWRAGVVNFINGIRMFFGQL
jgi:hypothetical protein